MRQTDDFSEASHMPSLEEIPEYLNPEFFKTPSGEEVHRTRDDDTLNWVFNHPEMLNFRDSKQDEILCLEADPGCGKSVCTKSLVHEQFFNTSDGLAAACFITKIRPQGTGVARALRSLLYQIFSARPKLMRTHAAHFIDLIGASILNDERILWDILASAATDPAAGDQIVLLIDGVDECDGPHWLPFKVANLWKSIETRKIIRRPILKLFYTTVPDMQPPEVLRSLEMRKISSNDHITDIKNDLKTLYERHLTTYSDLSYNPIHISQGFEKLFQHNPNYLAFYLFRPQIEKRMSSPLAIGRSWFVSSMPRALDNMYHFLFRENNNYDLLRVLSIILGVAEPLTPEELSVAFAVDSEKACYDELHDYQPQNPEQFPVRTCGPLIKIVGNKVYPVHHSLVDYLNSATKYGRPARVSSIPIASHNVLANACISILNLEYIEKSRARAISSSSSVDTSGFLGYAQRNWLYHLRNAYKSTLQDKKNLKKMCTPQRAGEIPFLIQICRDQNAEIAKLATELEYLVPRAELTEEMNTILVLYIAAWLGLDVLLRHMLPRRWGKERSSASKTNLAQIFVNHAPRMGYLTPLGIATKNGHWRSVELLLQGETVPLEYDLPTRYSLQICTDLEWRTLFQYAEKLFERDGGSAYRRVRKQYSDQLNAAATSGNPEYVKGLLSKGPKYSDIAMDSIYNTSLWAALDTEEPNLDIVQQLLDHGANANYRPDAQETLLEIAAQHENPQLVETLLSCWRCSGCPLRQ